MRGLLLIWWLPSLLMAQDPVRVAGIGSRVRLSFQDRGADPVVGQLMEIGSDSLVVSREKQAAARLPRRGIDRIEISVERKPDYRRGAGIGAAIGALAGAVSTMALAMMAGGCPDHPPETLDWNYCWDPTVGSVAAITGVSALLGAGIGAIHAADHPRDRWIPGRLESNPATEHGSRTKLLLGFGSPGRPGIAVGMRFAW
jgi:hypothetical protein